MPRPPILTKPPKPKPEQRSVLGWVAILKKTRKAIDNTVANTRHNCSTFVELDTRYNLEDVEIVRCKISYES